MALTLREGVNLLPFKPIFSSQKRTEPTNMAIVHVATRKAANCPGTVSRDVERHAGAGCSER